MKQVTFTIKTKGGHQEGMGDVVSSIAFGNEIKRLSHDVNIIINDNDNVKKLIADNGFRFLIAETIDELGIIKNKFGDIVILNQLNTSIDETQFFKKNSKLIVTIDDVGNSSKVSDICFNPLYPIENSFSDLKYIPLKQEVLEKIHHIKPVKQEVENILVIQGGSDTYGFIPKITESLYSIPQHINVNIVLGPNFLHEDSLNHTLKKSPRKFNFIKNKNDLTDIFIDSDIAITAAGFTLFELICLGVPCITSCAELFEVETAERIEKYRCCINHGFGRDLSGNELLKTVNKLMNNYELRLKMSTDGKALIDGKGSERIVHKIIDYFSNK